MILVPTHPQSTQSTSLPHHDFNNQSITTSPPNICIPHPLPLSPNIWHKPTHRISAFLVAAIKSSEHCYYFGLPIRRHRSSKLRNTRILPPDTHIPRPIPPKPNILIQPLTTTPSPLLYTTMSQTPSSPTPCHTHHTKLPSLCQTTYFKKIDCTHLRCSRTNITWREIDVC